MRNDDSVRGGGQCGHQPPEQERCRESTCSLRSDESWYIRRANAGKRLGQRSGESDNRIRKRRRRGEPAGGGDIGGDGERRGGGATPGAAPYDAEQTEGRHKLAEHLRRATAVT